MGVQVEDQSLTRAAAVEQPRIHNARARPEETRAEKSIRWAKSKWEASGARAAGMPEPGAYTVEGRAADNLYLGPDDRGGWAIVQNGVIVRRFVDRAEAWRYYKANHADPRARHS